VATKRKAKRTISIVGPGNLGSALATELARIGYPIRYIATRNATSNAPLKALARRTKSKVVTLGDRPLDTDIVWLTVPDDAIAGVARQLATAQSWKGKIVLHPSGARTSDELSALKKKGAHVASAHPMMTFVRGRRPQWRGVPFDIEGDEPAVDTAYEIATTLGASPYVLEKRHKTLYHAFGSFASPLAIALMSAMEQVAEAAGVPPGEAKRMIRPLLLRTLDNYFRKDAARAFSGPLVRGDVQTVRKHLAELKRAPHARDVYIALARAAIKTLPVKNREALEEALRLDQYTIPLSS
jgi:predicted short-subunit dehydrogenase-like oxidoreductase (DUF2520 family)